jgi:hypothetical protein
MQNNELSIIISTLGRKIELRKLLNSLNLINNDLMKFEVIIVDQNPIGYFDEIIDFNFTYLIKYFNVNFKGLSKAKNFGVTKAQYKFVTFPDDDCVIFDDTYINAFNLINKYSLDIVSGKCIDVNGKDSVQKFKANDYYLNLHNFEGGFIEATSIIKKNILIDFKFDENLGIGEFFGAHEGYDWLYRVITKKKYKIYFSNSIKFYHPQVLTNRSSFSSLRRVNSYTYGFVYSRLTHKQTKKIIIRFILVCILLLYYIVTLSFKKFKYYIVELLSIIIGIILFDSFKNKKNDYT